MLGILSGLSPKVVGGLILALATVMGCSAGLFWLLMQAHQDMGALQAKYDSSKAQIDQNEKQHNLEIGALGASLAARDAELIEAKGRAMRLSDLLEKAGENDDELDYCLHEIVLPDPVIGGLPK
ncbi:hypothetical protein [Alcanivorax jadensis]|uniref:hypothetical protein n=1 Tax=Alcanivorax jadensis TaxID=64988 RepID=UPI00235546E6|nr:hypothetical protein [Alcanivorax jadensis]|tara:strand:+ start:1178 stop:1549 length:372 start_codon:yes stop_codon:yes gene_type:complete